VTKVIENTEGERIAPAAPCRSRATMSISDETDRAATSEVTAKSPRPIMKSLRRPSRSPIRPPSKRRPPKVRA